MMENCHERKIDCAFWQFFFCKNLFSECKTFTISFFIMDIGRVEYMIISIGKRYFTNEGNYCGEGTERKG